MLISEIKSTKPKTPEQQRIATMQATAKRASQAVKEERAHENSPGIVMKQVRVTCPL